MGYLARRKKIKRRMNDPEYWKTNGWWFQGQQDYGFLCRSPHPIPDMLYLTDPDLPYNAIEVPTEHPEDELNSWLVERLKETEASGAMLMRVRKRGLQRVVLCSLINEGGAGGHYIAPLSRKGVTGTWRQASSAV